LRRKFGLKALADRPRSTILLLPETKDAENLGALARSASAFGLDAVLLGPGSADFLSRRALRVSMGASLSMPFALVEGAAELELFRASRWSLVEAVVEPTAQDVDEWEPEPRTILALGEEYAGLGPAWRDERDGRVTIRMARGPDSLNVAAAGAILMCRLAARLASGSARD